MTPRKSAPKTTCVVCSAPLLVHPSHGIHGPQSACCSDACTAKRRDATRSAWYTKNRAAITADRRRKWSANAKAINAERRQLLAERRDEVNKKRRLHRATHLSVERTQQRIYYEKNKEHIQRLPSRQRIKADKEGARIRNRKWRSLNVEKAREYVKRWATANPEKVRAKAKADYLRHPDRATRWTEANLDRARMHFRKGSNTRRARKAAAFIEVVDPGVVFDRDGGMCGICRTPVERNERWHVDHVVPLSKGGVHSYDNVQLAHASCNLLKGVKVPRGQGLLLQIAG